MTTHVPQVLRETFASQDLIPSLHRFDYPSDVQPMAVPQALWHNRCIQPLDLSSHFDLSVPAEQVRVRLPPDLQIPASPPSTHWGSELENLYQKAMEVGLRTQAIAFGVLCVIAAAILFVSRPIPFTIGFLSVKITSILIRNLPERVEALWKNSLDLICGCLIATSLATAPVSLATAALFGGAGFSLCTR